MNYHEITVGEKKLKLRIAMRDHAELDKLCGGKFMLVLSSETGVASDPWGLLKNVILVATKPFAENGKWNAAQVDDLIDEMIDNGWMSDDAVDCVLRVSVASGFFPRSAAEDILRGLTTETLDA